MSLKGLSRAKTARNNVLDVNFYKKFNVLSKNFLTTPRIYSKITMFEYWLTVLAPHSVGIVLSKLFFRTFWSDDGFLKMK